MFFLSGLLIYQKRGGHYSYNCSYDKKHCENKKAFPYLQEAAQETFKNHCWSGNVRELENVILRALVLSNNEDISNNTY